MSETFVCRFPKLHERKGRGMRGKRKGGKREWRERMGKGKGVGPLNPFTAGTCHCSPKVVKFGNTVKNEQKITSKSTFGFDLKKC